MPVHLQVHHKPKMLIYGSTYTIAAALGANAGALYASAGGI